jgi:hypothetical protein
VDSRQKYFTPRLNQFCRNLITTWRFIFFQLSNIAISTSR